MFFFFYKKINKFNKSIKQATGENCNILYSFFASPPASSYDDVYPGEEKEEKKKRERKKEGKIHGKDDSCYYIQLHHLQFLHFA